MAAKGGVSDRVIQKEGRRKSAAYNRYIRSNIEDSGQVPRKTSWAGQVSSERIGTRSAVGP